MTDFFLQRLYSAASAQGEIFHNEIRPLIIDLRKGLNSTVLVYGSNGSGKTYTMVGTEGDPGIIPLSIRELFSKQVGISNLMPEGKGAFIETTMQNVNISLVEVFSNRAWDLVDSTKREIAFNEDIENFSPIDKLAHLPVNSIEHFDTQFKAIWNDRVVGGRCGGSQVGLRNDQTNRSHAILMIKVDFRCGEQEFRYAPFTSQPIFGSSNSIVDCTL